MVKKFFLILVLFSIVINLGTILAWDFNGTIHDINGTALYNATINVSIYSMGGQNGPSLVGTNSTYSNQTGRFNLSVANNDSWMYKIAITHFEGNKTDGSTPIDFIGQSLPMFPYFELHNGLLNVDFYLKPAGTINITAVGEEKITDNVSSSPVTTIPLNYLTGLEIINWTDSAIRWAYVNESDCLIFLNASYNVNMTFCNLNITNIRDFEQDPYITNIYYLVNDTEIEKCNLSTGTMNCTVDSDISSRNYNAVYGIEVINSSGIIYLSIENSTGDYLLEEYNSSLEYTGHNNFIGFAGKIEIYEGNDLYIAGNDTSSGQGIYKLKIYSGVEDGIQNIYSNPGEVSNFSQGEEISGIEYNPFDGLWYAASNLTDNLTQINFSATDKSFYYQIKDTKLGYPIAEYFGQGRVSQATIYVPRDRNYSIMIYPDEALPVSFEWNNFSAQSYSFEYNSNYNASTHTLNKQFNCTDSFKWVHGYIKNSTGSVLSSVDYFRIVPFVLEPGNMIYIGENGGMPYNMSAWRDGGASDVYNETTGFYNITLPASAENITYLLFATVKDGTNYYGGFLNKSLSYGDSSPEWNFTLSPLMSTNWENDNISMDSANGDSSVNISTAKQRFNLVNASNTSQILSSMNAHIELRVDYSNYNATEFTFMFDVDSQQDAFFYVPLLNTSVKEINIYSQNYAPKRIGQRTASQIIANPNISISEFSPGDIDGELNESQIEVEFYKSNSTCSVPNPSDSCSLIDDSIELDDFNPLSLVIGGGDLNFRVGLLSSGIIVEYINVDMLASGPPDALFDSSASESTSGDFESAMRFGSNGPTIYDYVLISMPYTEGNSSQTGLKESSNVNISIPLLYGDSWDTPIWNATANGTNGTLLAGNYSHYSEHASEWETLLEDNTCVTNQSEFNSTNPCYIDTDNNRIWIRLPHFSGVKPFITGDVVTASSSDDSSSSQDSSGSGTGISTTFWTMTHVISNEQFENGYTKQLPIKSRIKVSVDNEYHYIGVVELTETTAKINVSSTPMQVILNIGQNASFDVNNNGYYDIYVKLNSIENNRANITVQKINEKVPEGEGPVKTQGEITSDEHESTVQEKKSKIIWWEVLIGILVIFVIWFVVRMKKKQQTI